MTIYLVNDVFDLTLLLNCYILMLGELVNDVEKVFADVLRFWPILFIFVISYNIFLLPLFAVYTKSLNKLFPTSNVVS